MKGLRIAIVGGGPGGLFLALLLRRANPDHQVTVWERNPAGATYGFGVAFSDDSLGSFATADPDTHEMIQDRSVRWDHIQIRHRGRSIDARGHALSAIGRSTLLHVLRERAVDLGAELRFDTPIESVDHLPEFDLLVGADGVNSVVRRLHQRALGATVTPGRSQYIWFGAQAATGDLFDALTFIFEPSEAGPFGVHAYPYGVGADAMSAFIVETDEDTLRRAGIDSDDDGRRSQALCETLFADHLGGHQLVSNNSGWMPFQTVRCPTWSHGNAVLLGDAAHTAHFSLGSGTKMAMEDAIALARALARPSDLAGALTTYQRERKPAVDRLQLAAAPSLTWWERFRTQMGFGPEQFAFHMLTRTGLLSLDALRRRDHRLTRTVERWFGSDTTWPALGKPITVGDLRLPNRVVARPGPAEADLVHLAGYAVCGAGMVMATVPYDDVAAGRWRPIADAIHRSGPARVALELGAADLPEPAAALADEFVAAAKEADEAGFDALAVDATDLDLVRSLRAGWPDGKPLLGLMSVTAPVDIGLSSIREWAVSLAAAGCDAVGVAVPGVSPLAGMSPRMAQALICDCVRNEAGCVVMMIGGLRTDDEANTWILSSRVDLCCGTPRLASLGWS